MALSNSAKSFTLGATPREPADHDSDHRIDEPATGQPRARVIGQEIGDQVPFVVVETAVRRGIGRLWTWLARGDLGYLCHWRRMGARCCLGSEDKVSVNAGAEESLPASVEFALRID